MSGKDFFNEMAGQWDSDSMRTRIARSSYEAIREVLEKRTKENHKNKEGILLDYGCGTGLVSLALADYFESIRGVDFSEGMVDEFNKKAHEHDLKARAEVHESLSEYADNFCDTVISSMVFHHLKDPQVIMNDMHRILKPGGSVYIIDLEIEDGSFHPAGMEGVYHHGFDPAQMKGHFEKAGFADIDTGRVDSFTKENKDYSIFLTSGIKTK